MTDESRDPVTGQAASEPELPPPPPQSAGWATAVQPAAAAGPVPGLAYAGTLRRLVAYVIDIILAGIAVFGIAFLIIIPLVVSGNVVDPKDPITNIVSQLVAMVISAGYFILGWRQRRSTLGQLMLGLIVGNQTDGAKLTWGAAFVRWLALTLGPIPLVVTLVIPSLSNLVVFLQLVWMIVLLVTTATSPTKQGLHDRWAASLVVRRA